MSDSYQRSAKKSNRKFQLVGARQLLVEVPLPLAEVWEELQPEVEHLTGLAGLKIIRAVIEPRVRTREGQEVELDSYTRLQNDGRRQRAVREGIVAGLTARNYRRAVVATSTAQLKKLCERKLDGLDLAVILIDGTHLGKQALVVALGIETNGKKHVLGLWQGATENTAVVKDPLEDLVARGLKQDRRYLFVIASNHAFRPSSAWRET